MLTDDLVADDGDAGSAAAIEAAAAGGERLTTARPTPERFAAAYRAADSTGADAVLSIHLSGFVSGTASSARAGGRLPTAPFALKDSPAVRLVSRTVLRIRSGQVATVERVRTRSAAADLLVRLARDVAAGLPADRAVDVAVEHASAPGRAATWLTGWRRPFRASGAATWPRRARRSCRIPGGGCSESR